ncbi:nuclease-related domain-containing protein [Spongiactinospora rosea]|nr:nuclease-related domain-containing protein [Spongiactinospora rosea]
MASASPVPPAAPSPRPRSSGAGASAYARYRAELAAGRPRRLVIRGIVAAVAAVVGWIVLGFEGGLLFALAAAVADTVYQWRRHEAVRTWRRGARGERRTARQLRRLEAAGYLVLHDRALPTGRANLDHLAIGPSGVYVIDSKAWSPDRRITRRGRYVNVGRRWGSDEVKSVRYETRSVAAALRGRLHTPVEVTPVLAVHGPHVPLRGLDVDGVRMLRASMVSGWVLRRPARLSAADVARIEAAAAELFPAYTENENLRSR